MLRHQHFVKILPMGAELFHAKRQADGQTDMTNVVVACRSFRNSPKNYNVFWIPFCSTQKKLKFF